MLTEANASVPTEARLMALYLAADTWQQPEVHRQAPRRSGLNPGLSGQESVTPARARGFLERRSERVWCAEVIVDWGYLYPDVLKQSEWNRRSEAGGSLRGFRVSPLPIAPGVREATDTAPMPMQHPGRVRVGTSIDWDRPSNDLVPRFSFRSTAWVRTRAAEDYLHLLLASDRNGVPRFRSLERAE